MDEKLFSCKQVVRIDRKVISTVFDTHVSKNGISNAGQKSFVQESHVCEDLHAIEEIQLDIEQKQLDIDKETIVNQD